MIITNPAFGFWSSEDISEAFIPKDHGSRETGAINKGGRWCPGCRANNFYHWLDPGDYCPKCQPKEYIQYAIG